MFLCYRALLPPTEYGWTGPSYKSSSYPSLPANYSNGLLSKPETWLPDEAKRLQIAKKLVREYGYKDRTYVISK